jgi:hypothetical protein
MLERRYQVGFFEAYNAFMSLSFYLLEIMLILQHWHVLDEKFSTHH